MNTISTPLFQETTGPIEAESSIPAMPILKKYKLESIRSLFGLDEVHCFEVLSAVTPPNWAEHDLNTIKEIDLIFRKFQSSLSINLTTQSIMLLDDSNIQAASAICPSLILEWVESRDTESLLSKAAAKLNKWREMYGVKISLDDMGKGQDCIERFLLVKPDYAKIEGTLLHGARHDHSHQNALRFLCSWCKSEDVPTVIEWIETEQDLQIARDVGGTYGQGRYLEEMDNGRKFA